MKHGKLDIETPGHVVCVHCNQLTRFWIKCFLCGKVLMSDVQLSLEIIREEGPEVERGDETGG